MSHNRTYCQAGCDCNVQQIVQGGALLWCRFCVPCSQMLELLSTEEGGSWQVSKSGLHKLSVHAPQAGSKRRRTAVATQYSRGKLGCSVQVGDYITLNHDLLPAATRLSPEDVAGWVCCTCLLRCSHVASMACSTAS